MTSIRLVEKKFTSRVLVVGLARTSGKKLQIESGDITLDTTNLLKSLTAMGASGAPDETIKIPYSQSANGGKKSPSNLDLDRKSTRLNSSHSQQSRMPSSA